MLTTSYRRQRGLSLIELMITISLGLVLMAALTSVFSNTLGVNSRSLDQSQLHEEATAVMALIVGDLRRAGYRGDAAEQITDPTNASTAFDNSIVITNYSGEPANSCISFSFDENKNGVHDGASENFGYRLRDGQVQRRQSSASCTSSGWQSLTSSTMLQVNGLTFTMTERMLNLINEQVIDVNLQVAVPSDASMTRELSTRVVIRNAF
ncbi:prepilin-type N-terminal cleavage/methylation domain-containing protein [Pseudidiomarina sp.]|uniref:prepilin-type N-terminal cleavage/methylation domain-containing protein n=1 Tax=Pseudidiomarina sp. TaxID=2081707 RepID=UPI00299E0374|nr:prepilin-type N-terminal cleavage/methylation domain-containing protein [Pseudidiomarina sp.]MDX1706670.1 prepilin-type N-terminal cleavage/methylation domain-containing protein [Pseudidiomarina sp.]